jgi:hypothetical protein
MIVTFCQLKCVLIFCGWVSLELNYKHAPQLYLKSSLLCYSFLSSCSSDACHKIHIRRLHCLKTHTDKTVTCETVKASERRHLHYLWICNTPMKIWDQATRIYIYLFVLIFIQGQFPKEYKPFYLFVLIFIQGQFLKKFKQFFSNLMVTMEPVFVFTVNLTD